MKKFSVVIFMAVFILFLANGALWAASFKSDTPLVAGGTVIGFEEYAGGTYISAQYAGVTFGQAPSAGSPQIDDYANNGWFYGFGGSSGTKVLTGSTQGGYPTATVAGITVTFENPVYEFQAFFSDTNPLGAYTVKAFGSGGTHLESFEFSETLSAAYLSAYPLPNGDRFFPRPNQLPLPGIYIGFQRLAADIKSIQIGPGSSVQLDSFAIDDVQFKPSVVPEPATMLLLGLGLIGLAGMRRKIK